MKPTKSDHRTYTLNNYTQSNHYKKSWCFNEKHCVFQFGRKHCRLSTWSGRLLKRLASIKWSRGAKVVRKGMFKKRWTVYWFGIKPYWGNGKRGFTFLKSSQIMQRYHVSSPIKRLLIRKISWKRWDWSLKLKKGYSYSDPILLSLYFSFPYSQTRFSDIQLFSVSLVFSDHQHNSTLHFCPQPSFHSLYTSLDNLTHTYDFSCYLWVNRVLSLSGQKNKSQKKFS